VIVIVEKLVEWRLAGETEVLGENLPQRHFVHHKSNMTRSSHRNFRIESGHDTEFEFVFEMSFGSHLADYLTDSRSEFWNIMQTVLDRDL
jgi:hypothetical protein